MLIILSGVDCWGSCYIILTYSRNVLYLCRMEFGFGLVRGV
jgi:hypothetical protein